MHTQTKTRTLGFGRGHSAPECPPDCPTAPGPRHDADLALARDILSGSQRAWHEFIRRYSRLITSVIRRYLPWCTEDECRTLQAATLESVYRFKLARYEGRASLATWLVLVTRSAVVDEIRRRSGSRDLRDASRRLPPFEREVFQRYYLQGVPFRELRASLAATGHMQTIDELVDVLHSIERKLANRLARRLQYELHAQSVAGASGRLLEYLDHVRDEFEARADIQRADFAMLESEARATIERVRREISTLPKDERELLRLRFEEQWTAGRIAEELGVTSPRAVYTWLQRVVRSLRARLRSAESEEGRPG
jgi:DNA-directed RNA polymerase specialized sigma24 family protein